MPIAARAQALRRWRAEISGILEIKMLHPSPLARAALALAALVLAPPACSLGNVSRSPCDDDAACALAFGVGSTCSEGYCGNPGACSTGHDCRNKYGGGACVDGSCRLYLPENAQCSVVDPPDLLDPM